jgi:hypothetical protein
MLKGPGRKARSGDWRREDGPVPGFGLELSLNEVIASAINQAKAEFACK